MKPPLMQSLNFILTIFNSDDRVEKLQLFRLNSHYTKGIVKLFFSDKVSERLSTILLIIF